MAGENTQQASNRRIARNTLFLYGRMLFTLLTTLYTSRVILDALGVEDFGIYNVVGGVIGMMSFFNNSMASATQRFLNYEMGKGNKDGLSGIFSSSFICYCFLIAGVVILAESVGIWFVEHKLTVPDGRKDAAMWVYQFSLLSFAISMLSIPYNAAIIAHERMSAFAYIGISEVAGKLAIAFFIPFSPIDRLVFYAILMCGISGGVFLVYFLFCRKHFGECRIRWAWNPSLLKRLLGFSGWMVSGTLAQMFSTQGVNILINIFFGPAFNAARAVAMQVYNAVNNFVTNFMTATRPQIVQSYARKDYAYTYSLTFGASRFSFYLLFILSVSILFETGYILDLWLKQPPQEAALFTRLVLLDLFLTTAYSPLAVLSQASGKIRNYQLVISACFLSTFFLTWAAFKAGLPAYAAFTVLIGVDLAGLFARIAELKRSLRFPAGQYLRKVMLPVASVFTVTLAPCYMVSCTVDRPDAYGFAARCALYILLSAGLVYAIGLNKAEKALLNKMILKHFKK